MTSRSERLSRSRKGIAGMLADMKAEKLEAGIVVSASVMSGIGRREGDPDPILTAIWLDPAHSDGRLKRHTLSQYQDAEDLIRELRAVGAVLSTVRFELLHLIQEEP